AAGEETLSPAEREALTQSIRSAVATPHAPTDAIRSFPTAGVQGVVQEVNVEGQRGTVLMRRGTNLLNVPFAVQGLTNAATQRVRVVRP
ncbi:MAG: hypothetical protein IT580_10885, partial [Verrucomicrobiales bacterium]|nr:hypothetical protein [Verrucomicrobiales bacterium]